MTPPPTAAEARADLVRRDLDNVVHPIVPHKQLEERQLVITSAKGSTVVDADGREYLDGMAGLWCVNIGYGRTELADVAAKQMRELSYYPHTAMNAPAGPPIWTRDPPSAEMRNPATTAVTMPASGLRPVAIASAMASGSAMTPTVSPAITSAPRSWRE